MGYHFHIHQNKEDEYNLKISNSRWRFSLYGGEGESDIVERYLKEKDEEVGKSGKVQ